MAKQINTSIGGVVKKVSKVRAGVGGVVKTVKKGVCSIGGVVKTFFSGCPIISVYVDPDDTQASSINSSVTWTEGVKIYCFGYCGSSAGDTKTYIIELEEPITATTSVEYTATVTWTGGSVNTGIQAYMAYCVKEGLSDGGTTINTTFTAPANGTATKTMTETLDDSTLIYGFKFCLRNNASNKTWMGEADITSIKIDGEEILAV